MRAPLAAIVLSLGMVAISAWFAGASAQVSLSANVGTCDTDDEVSANERVYEKSAMVFAETLLGEHPEWAYALLTPDLRGQLTGGEFVKKVEQGIRKFRPFAELHVEHGYRVTQTVVGSGRSNAICTAVAHGSIGKPEGRVTISTFPVKLQAHVIIEGKAANDRWAFTIWLVPSLVAWDIAAFDVRPSTILDRTATDIWTLARQEQTAGRSLNAYILYASAVQLAYRGPDFQLGIQPEISKEFAALELPREFKGKGPYDWKLSDSTYHVTQIGPTGIGAKVYLSVTYTVAQTEDNKGLEQQNRALITSFEDVHPDYMKVFDGLLVTAVRPDGTGFRSADEKHPGQ